MTRWLWVWMFCSALLVAGCGGEERPSASSRPAGVKPASEGSEPVPARRRRLGTTSGGTGRLTGETVQNINIWVQGPEGAAFMFDNVRYWK